MIMAVLTFRGDSADFIRGELEAEPGVSAAQMQTTMVRMLMSDVFYLTFRRLNDDGMMIDHAVDVFTTPDRVRSLMVWEEPDAA